MNEDQLAEMNLRRRLRFSHGFAVAASIRHVFRGKARQQDLEELNWMVRDLEAKKSCSNLRQRSALW